MSDLVFLEYSFDKNKVKKEDLHERLIHLGFSFRSKHTFSSIEVWVQNRFVLFIKEEVGLTVDGEITGIGLLNRNNIMDTFPNAVYDVDTNFYVLSNNSDTFRFYFADTPRLDLQYETVSEKVNKNNGLISLSGLVIDTNDESIISMLHSTAEKVIQGEKYKKFMYSNKITVLQHFDKNSGVTKIISETNDVFKTTSMMSANKVGLLRFDNFMDEDFGALNHKIIGYNCRAFGDPKSFSIENYIPAQDLNVDIIFRERKQYIKIKEHTLNYYDSIREH